MLDSLLFASLYPNELQYLAYEASLMKTTIT